MKVPFKRCAIFAIALIASAEAHAQQATDWQFEATPYLWFAGMQGTSASGRSPSKARRRISATS